MRIAIVNWSNRQIGGTGTYLRTVVPAASTPITAQPDWAAYSRISRSWVSTLLQTQPPPCR